MATRKAMVRGEKIMDNTVQTGYPSIEYFYRKQPIRDFDPYDTMYSFIKKANQNCMNMDAIGFLGTTITYKTLFKRADRLADAFHTFGVSVGETVCICTINMPVVQECLLALSKIGAVSEWIDLRIKGNDLVSKINESNCKVIVVFDGILDTITDIAKQTKVEKIIVVSPTDYLGTIAKTAVKIKEFSSRNGSHFTDNPMIIPYQKFINSGKQNSSLTPVEFDLNRPAIVVQSSGSTGTPKSILHTDYNLNFKMVQESYSDLPLIPGKCMHVCIPPFIIYGLVNSIYGSMAFGLKAELSPFISETTVYDDLGKFEIACCTPTHLRYIYSKLSSLYEAMESPVEHGMQKDRISNDINSIQKKLSKVDIFISGGDKLYPEELLSMEHLFSKPIINGYGNNELVGAAIITPVFGLKPESVGIPMKYSEVSAFDVGTDNILSNGEEGEIAICADNTFIKYIGNPEATNEIKKKHSDGKEWVHTGDLGYIDNDGYVYITGRCKRVIKRASFKIAPETIESKVMNIPAVKDCVVVGVSDEKEMEVPFCFVEFHETQSVTTETIESFCRRELPDYEIPKYVHILERIPYKNHKHDFIELEQLAKDILFQN